MARKGGKYLPLTNYLINSNKAVEELSYEKIETILGNPLPKSAYNNAAMWWSNGSQQAHYWQKTGWVVYKVLEQKIIFIKNNASVNIKLIIDWTLSIKREPNFSIAYVKRGHAFAKINKTQEAIQDLQTALNLGLNNEDTEKVKKKLLELRSSTLQTSAALSRRTSRSNMMRTE